MFPALIVSEEMCSHGLGNKRKGVKHPPTVTGLTVYSAPPPHPSGVIMIQKQRFETWDKGREENETTYSFQLLIHFNLNGVFDQIQKNVA